MVSGLMILIDFLPFLPAEAEVIKLFFRELVVRAAAARLAWRASRSCRRFKRVSGTSCSSEVEDGEEVGFIAML